MEIKNVLRGVNPYEQKKVGENQEVRNDGQASKTGTAGDKVSFSPEAKLTGVARQTAMSASDVRMDKVEELKRQIKDGTFKPDIRKTAENLVRDDLSLIL